MAKIDHCLYCATCLLKEGEKYEDGQLVEFYHHRTGICKVCHRKNVNARQKRNKNKVYYDAERGERPPMRLLALDDL